MPDTNRPINPERRQNKGMLIIFSVVALGVLVALGYAILNGGTDMTNYEPAAGIESPAPMTDTTMDNDTTGTPPAGSGTANPAPQQNSTY